MLKIIFRVSAFAMLAACLAAGQSAKSNSTPMASFIGRWEVGLGVGKSTFYITLDKDGQASKSTGESHGKWAVRGDEARIAWDDGWHDVIRKAGNHYEKAAYAPGKSFTDTPSNVTSATRTEPL
jgi:hypothetical protein